MNDFLGFGCSLVKLGRPITQTSLKLNPGDTVEVRTEAEIRSTLSAEGTLDGLPFMPEMAKYCGCTLRVLTRLDRMLVEGIGNRRTYGAVILEGVTCDGSAHEECRRTCRILWKEDWLRRLSSEDSKKPRVYEDPVPREKSKSKQVSRAVSCQLISLPCATRPLAISFEDVVRQYLSTRSFAQSGIIKRAFGFLLWLNFKYERFLGRKKYGSLRGRLKKTPSASLKLEPGDLIEIKSKEEILATLDLRGRNRGLHLTHEMLKYCGGRYRVMKRVDQMISERTENIRKIPNTVILEGVTCDGTDHANCPRRCYCLWREIWLKRA